MCKTARVSLPCTDASVSTARRWVAEQVAGMYAQPGEIADDASFVVAELVWKCARTDQHYLTLTLEGHYAQVRVEAMDAPEGVPAVLPRTRGEAVSTVLAMPIDAVPGFDCAA